MNLLLLTDFGFHLSQRSSLERHFIEHFWHEFSKADPTASADVWRFKTLAQSAQGLMQQNLDAYDLVVWQLPMPGTYSLPALLRERALLTEALDRLHAQRHKLLLVSPVAAKSLRATVLNRMLLFELKRWPYSLFETSTRLSVHNECWQNLNLSSIGHQLLGTSLFDFYLEDPLLTSLYRRNANRLP